MQDLRTWLDASADRHLAELFDLLRIPSVSTDPEHAGDVRRAGQWVRDKLASAGIAAELHDTPGHPIVYGEWLGAPGAPTVLVYGHYDVQPPDPLDEWVTGPFEPTIRDGKIFARGATDDKGQMYAHLVAAEAHMAVHGRMPVNVKYLIEGEEEVGSANLENYIKANRERLAADVVVISDTSMFAPGVPAIVYGLRGLAYFEMTVEGPTHDLHSGLYGGTVANPINVLCDIIAGLKDQNGHITVPGFYDDVRDLTEEERAAWRELPHSEETWRASCGAETLTGEAGFSTLERRWGRPTLDCNGIWGGFTGAGAKTVLPAKATAKFSCRLVPDQAPRKIEDLVEAAVKKLAPDSVRVTFRRLHGGHPVVVDTNHPAVGAAKAALTDAFGAEAVFIRGGGSIPVVADFSTILGIPSVLMGFGLPDDRLHSPNEKYDLACFHGGLLGATLFLSHYAG